MFFKQIASMDASLSYFFGCSTVGKAVDVVAGDEERFVDEATIAAVRIAYVMDTHVHADHCSGGPRLAGLAGATYALPDDVEIFPGHQAGSACGVGLSGKPSSTLGFEKRWNPLLSMRREAFIAATREVPLKPAGMERVLLVNRGLPT